MAYQLNIRNPSNSSWIDLLKSKYHSVDDIDDNFLSSNTEDILKELFVTKTTQIKSIADPNTGDYQYPIGTIWTNTTNSLSFICTDNTVSFAEWKQITTLSDNTDINDIVGDMVNTNVELGINVSYDNINYKLDFEVASPTITLNGDISGGGVLQHLSNLDITTTSNSYNMAETDAKYFDVSGDTITGYLNMGDHSVDNISNDTIYDRTNVLLTENAIRRVAVDAGWMNSVHSKSYNEPYSSGSPSGSVPYPPLDGYRFIVKEPSTGAWLNYDNQIAEWNNNQWLFKIPHEASTLYVIDEKRYYMYGSSEEWINVLQDSNIEIVDELNYFTYDYLDGVLNELYMKTGGPSGITAPTGLEIVNDNSSVGWRLVGKNPDNYGDIGTNAVDLSTSTSNSIVYGATGDYSFTVGVTTTASGESSCAIGNSTVASGLYSFASGFNTISKNSYSHVSGRYNIGVSTSTIFEVGMGYDDINRKNAFEIYNDGTLTAPESTIINIDTRGLKTLTTKEYVDSVLPDVSTGLEKITENTKTGWRLIDQDPSTHGDIGTNAVDFTTQSFSNDYGATGDYSFAVGTECRATNYGSISMGNTCTANGDFSVAMGNGTTAIKQGSFAIGTYNEGYIDTHFEIGTGSSTNSKENVLEIYDDKVAVMPNTNIGDIKNRGAKSLITKEYFDTELPNPNIVINPTLIIGLGTTGTINVGDIIAKRWEVTVSGTISVNVTNSDVDPVISLYNGIIIKQESESMSEYKGINATVVVSVTYGNIWINGYNVLAGIPWITTWSSISGLGSDLLSIGDVSNTSIYQGLKIEYGINPTPFYGPWMDYESEMLKSNIVYP